MSTSQPLRKIDPPKSSSGNEHLRALSHELCNALETVLQASYLLQQSPLDEDPKRWARLIDEAANDAARLTREMRAVLIQQS